ncbi:MAG TPA: GNAT family N-acetyltransferase, partial [Oculatellaceae cyanobacterium]
EEKIFFLPYLLRQCNNLFKQKLIASEMFDVISPYGYPGILLNEAAANTPEFLELAINQLIEVWRTRQVCSAFLRLHPILNGNFNSAKAELSGETVSIDLRLSIAEIWHQTRPEHRNKINRCKRLGFEAKMVPFHQYINDFILIYRETMEREGAAQLYYFDEKYFWELSEALGDQLHLCVVEADHQISCAGLFTECCSIVQYHLGGTKNEFLKQAPSKLMFDYVRFWAKERGNEVFHIGGGVGSSKDSLYHFKAGFSKERHKFMTIRLITNESQYRELVELRAKDLNTNQDTLIKTNFFPAYRSSVTV